MRLTVADGTLTLAASGTAPVGSSPTAGLLLFYDDKLYCGLCFDAKRFVTHRYGAERGRPAIRKGAACGCASPTTAIS